MARSALRLRLPLPVCSCEGVSLSLLFASIVLVQVHFFLLPFFLLCLFPSLSSHSVSRLVLIVARGQSHGALQHMGLEFIRQTICQILACTLQVESQRKGQAKGAAWCNCGETHPAHLAYRVKQHSGREIPGPKPACVAFYTYFPAKGLLRLLTKGLYPQ